MPYKDAEDLPVPEELPNGKPVEVHGDPSPDAEMAEEDEVTLAPPPVDDEVTLARFPAADWLEPTTPGAEANASLHGAEAVSSSPAPETLPNTTSTATTDVPRPPWLLLAPSRESPTSSGAPLSPWSSNTASQRRPLPPPPALPRIKPDSVRAVALQTPSSAPPLALATSVPLDRERRFGAVVSAIGPDNARKAIIMGSALIIVFGVLYLGRDRLMGVPPPPPPPLPSAALTASVKASAKQQGVTVVVDGRALGALPLELKDLSPGGHSIVFEGGDRYLPRKTTVTLAPGEVKELEPVSLVVTNGAATFDVKTAGASLALVAADERRELVDYSHPVEIDNSKSWLLEASKPGYKKVTLPVTFEDQAEKTFVVALEEASEHPAPPAVAAVQPDVPRAVAPKAPQATEPSGSNKTEATASGNCTLSIDSTPAAHLTLDGRPVGNTPRMGMSIPAGTHSLMFVSERGKRATIVTCKSGEQKAVNVQLGH
jgi:hypothetical protein